MFNVGDVEIKRVEETYGPGFPPHILLPDWSAEKVAEHLSWLVPNYFDPKINRLISSVHSWVLKTRHHTILIDACAGNHKNRPDFARFHMLDRPYLANLAAAGVQPEQVDFVLCTHLHVDHVGWNTRLADGRWVPTFPNAKYVFSRTDRDYFDPARGGAGARNATNALVFEDSVQPILDAKQDQVVDGTHELGDGLLIEPAPGHTPGHVLITLASQGTEALFIGDIMHHPMQIYHPEWSSAFCTDPAQVRKTRRGVLERCVSKGSLLYPGHFGAPHIGRVSEKRGGFAYVPGRA
jgi:glyoxylase-like metal-dependent hydrolase (beta-lactamase superfamily II)